MASHRRDAKPVPADAPGLEAFNYSNPLHHLWIYSGRRLRDHAPLPRSTSGARKRDWFTRSKRWVNSGGRRNHADVPPRIGCNSPWLAAGTGGPISLFEADLGYAETSR